MRKKYILFYEKIIEGSMLMKEIVHLQNQIRTFEDVLLRSKDYRKIETIKTELFRMRLELQKRERKGR